MSVLKKIKVYALNDNYIYIKDGLLTNLNWLTIFKLNITLS